MAGLNRARKEKKKKLKRGLAERTIGMHPEDCPSPLGQGEGGLGRSLELTHRKGTLVKGGTTSPSISPSGLFQGRKSS